MPTATVWRFNAAGQLEAPTTPTLCIKPRPFGIGRFGVGLYARYQPGEWPPARRCEPGTWDAAEMCGCNFCGPQFSNPTPTRSP
jgi:hypothetical protein